MIREVFFYEYEIVSHVRDYVLYDDLFVRISV